MRERHRFWSFACAGIFIGIMLGTLPHGPRRADISAQKSCYGVLKSSLGPLDKERTLHIYGVVNFVPPAILRDFENLTGIHVVFDVFDTNELLEAKLFTGNSGYDVVFPTAWPYFARQLRGGVYQRLDKDRLRDVWHLDADLLRRLETIDYGNVYAAPYQWGVMGIGIRKSKVKKVLGKIPESWGLIFDPQNAGRLKGLRIEICDAPGEIFPAVLAFLGKNPESDRWEDLEAATQALREVRAFIARFTPSGYESLASGTASVVIGTSGDILRAQRQTIEEKPAADISFIFPKEGSALWVDVMAIPVGAPHPNNAHAFIKYLLHPRVMAAVTRFTLCANAVPASRQYLPSFIKSNPIIYPEKPLRDKCYVEKSMLPAYENARTRALTKVKSGY